MADVNQQTQELANTVEQLNRSLQMLSKMSQTTVNDFQDTAAKSKPGLDKLSKGSEVAADALTGIAKAGMAAAGAMYEGKKGAAAFNGAIDEMSNAAKLAGAALAMLVPGGPIIKLFIAGVTAAATATAEYVKKANEMADKVYTGYSKLAKSGAAAGDGMTGVFQGAKKLGLSMNELDQYVGLIGNNSKDLALFAGSVFEGRKRFEDIGKAMEPYRAQLMAAGLTQEQINEGTMGYLKLQTQLGKAQTMTNKELADGAKKYLYEMDGLSKLTGESRQEMEKNMEAARNEQRFRAKLEEVRMTQGEEAAKRLERANLIISSQSKEMGQAFRDISTGMIGTEAAQKGLRGTYGELMDATQKLTSGQIDEYEATQKIGKAAGQVAKDMNFSAQMGTFNDYATDYAGQLKMGIFAEKDKVEMAKLVQTEQEKQAKGADGITKQYADNVKQQQELNEKMEKEVFKGISNALDVTNKLGNVTEKLTGVFKELTDAANGLLNILGIGKGPSKEEKTATKSQDEKNWESASAVEKAQSSVARGMERFARGLGRVTGIGALENLADTAQAKRVESESAYLKKEGKFQAAPAAPAAPGSKGGATTAPAAPGGAGPAPAPSGGGGAAAGGTAPTPAKPQSKGIEGEGASAKLDTDKLLKFTERSGSKTAFESLDQTFKDAVLRASEEYQAVTGKQIQINSAKRDPKDQERLYAETVAAGRPGIGPTGDKVARPGSSLHEKGAAVDIQNYADPAAIAAFNRQGLFQKVPNDKVHFQAKEGGVFDGPDEGYNNIIMHGMEAVIPLKNGAVPVQLSGDMGPSAGSIQDMLKSVESAMSSQPVANIQMPSFAGINSEDLKLNIEEMQNQMLTALEDAKTSNLDATMPELPEGLETPGSMRDLVTILQQNSDRTGELVGLLNDLLRAQKEQNSISGRLLQVAAN